MWKNQSSIKKRLNMLLLVCLVPLTVVIIYLIVSLNKFSSHYDRIVENITVTNEYNINLKEDIDYIMYVIVANSKRASELVDIEKPNNMITEARNVFYDLYKEADSDYARKQLKGILTCLDTLKIRVMELKKDVLVGGTYEENMESLDLNIRVLTELLQEQIQEYIYYETANLAAMRETIRKDVMNAISMTVVFVIGILTIALLTSQTIMRSVTDPIQELCQVTKQAGRGDFTARAKQQSDDELAVLSSSFNRMIEKIGNLTEDIKVEQRNLRAMELKLLQAQINPHFLYNTLDAIIWLAESNQKEEVVKMVSALSDFFRTTLSKGRDYITIKEEEAHIRSYLQIQQFRYRDILDYEILISPEVYDYQILKLTLQPLVENALYHGIKKKRGMGHIKVTGRKEGDKIVFRVWDNGMGLNEEMLEYAEAIIKGEKRVKGNTSSGFGLFNVDQRIRLNYGSEYGIRLESEYGEWTEVKVEIPAVL